MNSVWIILIETRAKTFILEGGQRREAYPQVYPLGQRRKSGREADLLG
jgi:hypothetical protein